MSSTATTKTLTDNIMQDHREMYHWHDEYTRATGNKDAQERASNQLRWLIARHSVGEELVVYPLFEKYLGEQGKTMADSDREDHNLVKHMLYEIESYTAGTDEHTKLLRTIVDTLRKHNDTEENHDLPLLEPKLGKESSGFAQKFNRHKGFAPTRPHPGAPDKPPFETVAGLLSAPIDKLRDMFDKFPAEESTQKM